MADISDGYVQVHSFKSVATNKANDPEKTVTVCSRNKIQHTHERGKQFVWPSILRSDVWTQFSTASACISKQMRMCWAAIDFLFGQSRDNGRFYVNAVSAVHHIPKLSRMQIEVEQNYLLHKNNVFLVTFDTLKFISCCSYSKYYMLNSYWDIHY